MKKVISIVVAFFLICLIYEFGVLFFVKHYDYEYVYTKNKKEYKVNEKYNYIDGKHIYDINIKYGKNNYFYIINHNYHKEKQILEDLIVFKKNSMECIFPVFKDNVVSNVVCGEKGKTITYNHLNIQNDEFANEIKGKLIKKGYNIPAFNQNDETKEISNLATKLNYYNDFIPNYNILVWGYKGVFSINKKEAKVNDFLKSDIYDTKYFTIGKKNMYIMDVEGDMSSFDKIYALNLEDGKSSIIDVIEMNISSNSYFNGVYKDTVYFTDCNGNHQYKFNENKDNVEKLSSQGFIKYYDGKNLVNESVDDVVNNLVTFNNNIINEKITKLYNTSEIKKSNNHYYFKTSDGNFYLLPNNSYKNPVLLFNKQEMKEWIVIDDTIFGIVGNTLYAYNYNYGYKPIIRYEEFNYHTSNMFGITYIGD